MESINSSEKYEKIEKLIPGQVKQIRSILQDKYGIIVPDHCNEFLARCVRMKDGNQEKAMQLIKGFYAATAIFKTWDALFLPGPFEAVYLSGIASILIKKDSLGRIIFIGRVGMWDCERLPFDQAMAGIWMLLQYITANSIDAQRNGFVTIWDFAGFTVKQAMAVNKWRIPSIVKIVKNGVVGRIKEFHWVNHARIANLIYVAIKPFLSEKIKNRAFFHNNLDSLFSKLGKNNLPASIGGNLDTSQCMDTALMKELINQDKYFKDMMNDRFPSK